MTLKQLTFRLKKSLLAEIHRGVLLFFIEEVDQSDCIEKLIFNGALRLLALYKESTMILIVLLGLL
jgi:hypothetical protein